MVTIMMMRSKKHMMNKTMVVTKDVKSMVPPMLTMVLMTYDIHGDDDGRDTDDGHAWQQQQKPYI